VYIYPELLGVCLPMPVEQRGDDLLLTDARQEPASLVDTKVLPR
jgi:hypothetical protein